MDPRPPPLYFYSNILPWHHSWLDREPTWIHRQAIRPVSGPRHARWAPSKKIDMGVSSHGDTPKTGWFNGKSIYKWIITRGTPMTLETSIFQSGPPASEIAHLWNTRSMVMWGLRADAKKTLRILSSGHNGETLQSCNHSMIFHEYYIDHKP